MTSAIHSRKTQGAGRKSLASRKRASRGGAMVEFAIMAPILVALIMWANYFWEVQLARIKAAEVARYIGFERTVRPDLNQIKAEALSRYRDLDGSTKGNNNAPAGLTNGVTLTVNANLAAAPLAGSISEANGRAGGSAGGFMSQINSLVGDSVESIIGLMGFKVDQGAVQATVQIKIKNKIIPEKIASYVSGFNDNRLDLTLNEKFFVYHDTWRAWNHGSQPSQSYPTVERLTRQRVRQVAYLGLYNAGAQFLDPIGQFLSFLNLEWPLAGEYIDDSVLMRKVRDNGRYRTMYNRPNRTVPGDVLQAGYWINDGLMCFGNQRYGQGSCNNKEPQKVKQKRGLVATSGDLANWPLRAYNCRGDYFQGAVKSDAPEIEYSASYGAGKTYFNYNNDTACRE
jgi:hypothetical protein